MSGSSIWSRPAVSMMTTSRPWACACSIPWRATATASVVERSR
jgi:hypothetical protein